MSARGGDQADWSEAYIIVNIEILSQRISPSGYSLIVWDEGGVIESAQINPFHHRAGHFEWCSEGQAVVDGVYS